MNITLCSFGFKHGPVQADCVWDVRFLPNPFWVAELQPHTGKEPQIARYVLENESGAQFLALLEPMLLFLCGQFRGRERDTLALAVGCTGGRHRSVAVCEYLRLFLERNGLHAEVHHRDIDKD